MPVNRKLYTVGEMKELLAKKNKVPIKNVSVYDNATLHYNIEFGEEIELGNDHFLFQINMY
jgi:hypothetical protein